MPRNKSKSSNKHPPIPLSHIRTLVITSVYQRQIYLVLGTLLHMHQWPWDRSEVCRGPSPPWRMQLPDAVFISSSQDAALTPGFVLCSTTSAMGVASSTTLVLPTVPEMTSYYFSTSARFHPVSTADCTDSGAGGADDSVNHISSASCRTDESDSITHIICWGHSSGTACHGAFWQHHRAFTQCHSSYSSTRSSSSSCPLCSSQRRWNEIPDPFPCPARGTMATSSQHDAASTPRAFVLFFLSQQQVFLVSFKTIHAMFPGFTFVSGIVATWDGSFPTWEGPAWSWG